MYKIVQLKNYAMILIVISSVVLLAISIYSTLRIAGSELVALISKGTVQPANIAFVSITSMIFTILIISYLKWKTSQSFIYVGRNHSTVELVNRRDEFNREILH